MKKIGIGLVLILLCATNSHAFVAAIVEGAMEVKEEAYKRFMMLKAVQNLKAVTDTYEESKRYFDMMKKINEGSCYSGHVPDRIMDIGDDTAKKQQANFDDDWLSPHTKNNPQEFIDKSNGYTTDNLQYAGKVFKLSREAEQEAEKIALQADKLDTRSTQTTNLKVNTLLLQMAAQQNANLAHLIDLLTRTFKVQLDKEQQAVQETSIVNQSLQSYEHVLQQNGLYKETNEHISQ